MIDNEKRERSEIVNSLRESIGDILEKIAWIIGILELIGTIYLSSNLYYDFNFVIFFVGILITILHTSLLLGLSEIISSLQRGGKQRNQLIRCMEALERREK